MEEPKSPPVAAGWAVAPKPAGLKADCCCWAPEKKIEQIIDVIFADSRFYFCCLKISFLMTLDFTRFFCILAIFNFNDSLL